MELFQSTFSMFVWLCLSHLSVQSVASLDTLHRHTIEGVPPLLFQGTLLNDLQNPISNASIQLWQTDPLGVYDHPDAAGSNSLDETFQYCGTAKTDIDGSFTFLTHRPGTYANRPTHFHYKVWIDGQEMLTSQFYFADENTSYSDMQIIRLQEYEFENGVVGYATNKTIVLDMNLGGNGPFTPSDMEGPFYPVFDFLGYGNNLINASFIESDEMNPDGPTLKPSLQLVVTDAPVQSPTTANESVIYGVPALVIDENATNAHQFQLQSSHPSAEIDSDESAISAMYSSTNDGDAVSTPTLAEAGETDKSNPHSGAGQSQFLSTLAVVCILCSWFL
jgi:hypothetical protein